MVNSARFRNSYFKRIRSYLGHLVSYLFGLLTIVNNGNTWYGQTAEIQGYFTEDITKFKNFLFKEYILLLK